MNDKKNIIILGVVMLVIFSLIPANISSESIPSSGEGTIFEYNFIKGWNLITLPLSVENKSIDALFEGLNMVSFVYGYNSSTQTYETVENLHPGYGYWLYSYENASITIEGYRIFENLSIPLKTNDNLVGWVHKENITAEDVCRTIPGCKSISIPKDENEEIPEYGPSYYHIHYSGQSDNNFKITQGMGFWININNDTFWNGSIANLEENLIPTKPNCKLPNDGELMIIPENKTEMDVDLKVKVSDPNNDTLKITFYDANTDIEIGNVLNINSGENVSIKWEGLTAGDYSWYAVAEDGYDYNISENCSFSLKEKRFISLNAKTFNYKSFESEIINDDDENLSNISWSVSITGGILGLINISDSGVVDSLSKGSEEPASIDINNIFGLGEINIKINAEIDSQIFTKEFSGFKIGKIIIVI